MRKKEVFIIVLLLFFNIKSYQQEALLIKDYKPEPYMETSWGPDNKHFAHYQIRYAFLVPGIVSSEIENTIASGAFGLGYIYRYKIHNIWDIGIEIGYENLFSRIDSDKHEIFDSVNNYDKMRTYKNCINISLFNRIVLGGNAIHKLGWYLDIGAYYNRSFSRGLYKYVDNNEIRVKSRIKNPSYLNKDDLGLFLRFGKNNLVLFLKYSIDNKWINNLNNNNYLKTPLYCGLQLNLYTK